MERCSVVRWSILILICLAGGCTAPRALSPLTWFGGRPEKSKSTAAAEKPKAAKPSKADEASKAKGDKPAKAETTVASAAEAKDAGADKSAKPASTENTKTVAHDAATLALIEKELKDLPPAERAQLEQDLKGQDPSLVRLILNNLRLTRQMGQYAPSNGVMQASAEVVSNPVPTAAANSPAGNQNGAGQSGLDRTHAAAGLGTVQPWNNQSAAAVAPAGQQGYNQPVDAFGTPVGLNNPYAAQAGNTLPTIQPAAQLDHQSYSPNTAAGAGGAVGQYAAAVPSGGGLNQVQPQSFMPQPGTFAAEGLPSVQQPGALAVAQGARANQVPGGPISPAPAVAAGAPVPNAQFTGVFPNSASPGGISPQPMNPQFSLTPGQSNPVSAKWKEDLDRLIATTEAAMSQMPPGPGAAEKQAYIQRQVYLRMLYLMAGQQQRALEAIRDIDSADQEFWQQVFWAMSNYFDAEVMPDPSDRAAQTVTQLRSAVQRLQEKARLELRNVNFCHKISSFGNYERFGRDEFSPNQDVLVYAEVNNFKSEPTAEGQYRTLLRSTIEIYKASPNGELVASMPFEPTPDLCSNHRRDYFHSYVVTIPPNIALGPYLLKLRVADELSGKTAEYTLKFAVK
ncbi:MAG: hypothetical protein WD648_12390 [Planctomycetaceae bacterium]